MIQIGFDVGGSHIAAGVVNEDKQIIARREIPFLPDLPYQTTVEKMADMVRSLCDELSIEPTQLASIGLSVPGSIDPSTGEVIHAHNLQFHSVPIVSEMKTHFPSLPIFLANDANAAALAELHAGAFRGCQTAVLLTLGTGVGGGVILGGKMFNGGLGHGVELGHMCLDLNGPLCTCGNRGCIETLCTATWLIQQGRELMGDQEKMTAKVVIDAAKEGDARGQEIFDRYVDQLSSALVSIANLLDPEVIALGGGVSLAGDFLFEPLREQVRQKSFFHFSHKVVPAELGNDAGIIGAAMLARN